MSKNLVSAAVVKLVVYDIYLHSSSSQILDDFEPRSIPALNNIRVQMNHNVKRSVTLSTEDNELPDFFRVTVAVGARWMELEDGSERTDSDSDKEILRADIQADFVAEYRILESLTQEEQQAFALHNASFHVWPYWREYLTSQCTRMNLPKISAPLFHRAENAVGVVEQSAVTE